jgi:translation elongation factor EF-Tu-like GTPase
MTVEDVFSIRKRGTVVTGTVELGPVRVGDTVQIDDGETVRVDGIEAFRKVLDEAQAGDNVGLLFRELDRRRVQRGAVLSGT